MLSEVFSHFFGSRFTDDSNAIEHLFARRFRHIVTGKAAAVSDSRLWVNHLILLYTALVLSAVNGCCGYCAAAGKQQNKP